MNDRRTKEQCEKHSQEMIELIERHKAEFISQKIADLIEEALFESDFLDDWQKANLQLIKKSYEEELCITSEMKREFSIASSESEFIWRDCRAKNDFKTFKAYFII